MIWKSVIRHGNDPIGAENYFLTFRISVAALDVGLDQALRQTMGERHDRKRGVLLAENMYDAAVTDIKGLTLEIFQVLVDQAAFRVSGHSAGAQVMNA